MTGLAALGADVVVVIGIGTGIGIGLTTSKAVDATTRQPETDDKITKTFLLRHVLVEATVIYDFVIDLLIILFLK